MTNLSPAAQAVLDASNLLPGKDSRQILAAALRAAADQLTPYSVEDMPGAAFCRNKILAIAAELEGANPSESEMTLESLDEHNARIQHQQNWNSIVQSRPNGIACPECGKELMDTNPNFALLTSPLQYRVHCPACGYTGTRF